MRRRDGFAGSLNFRGRKNIVARLMVTRDGFLEQVRTDRRTREARYVLADRYASAVLGALEGVDRRNTAKFAHRGALLIAGFSCNPSWS